MTTTTKLQEKAITAARRYLEVMGYDIIAENCPENVEHPFDFVAIERAEDRARQRIHFIDVSCNDIEERTFFDPIGETADDEERERFEHAIINASSYLDEDIFVNCELVASRLQLKVVREDRAIIRFVTNVLSR